jgi:hypothetical protein
MTAHGLIHKASEPSPDKRGYRNVAQKPQATLLSRSKFPFPRFGTGY